MFRTAAVVLCLGLYLQSTIASDVDKAQNRQKRSTEEKLTCADDYATTGICAACADLPPGMALPLEECCNDEGVQAVCSACLIDVEGCAREMINLKLKELEALKHGYDESEELEEQEMAKRFGRVFMGGGSNYGYSKGGNDKRYGTLFMSRRSHHEYSPVSEQKRYGKLFIGGRGRPSYGTSGLDTYLGEAKRYGTLFMGKRFGRLFLGKGYGKTPEAKRQSDSDADVPEQKRYGRLFLSGGHRYGYRTSNKKDSH